MSATSHGLGKGLDALIPKQLVETEFDLLAMVNAGKYTVKASKKFAKGQNVKLKIKQGVFGRKPVEITE